MLQPLKLLSSEIVERLSSSLQSNSERYLAGTFTDLAQEVGWSIETDAVQWDPAIADALDPAGTPDAEIRNSLVIYTGLVGMTPAIARDERIWARLCHIECLRYCRDRWLSDSKKLESQAKLHFFAPGLPGCRDDNAIGRLWWNGYIAALACPADMELALRRLLARANIRLQVIDRADTAFRQPLIRGVVRILADPWFELRDSAVADFMYQVNKSSGGIVFEALDEGSIDAHMAQCLHSAKLRHVGRDVVA